MLAVVTEHLAEAMSLDPAAMDDGSHLALEIDDLGQLHFEELGETLLVSLARDYALAADRLEIQKRALALAHPETTNEFPVQVGQRGDALVFIARLDANDLDSRDLDTVVEKLAALQDDAHS